MAMNTPITSFSFSSSVKVKLFNSGFHSAEDLSDVTILQLTEAGLGPEEAKEVVEAVQGAEEQQGGGVTAWEVLQQEALAGSIVTFCSRLDEALGGGLPVGRVTEVCGPPGVGKTQLCMQLAVDVQFPECIGGLCGEAMFLDTEGTCVAERLQELANAALKHCHLLDAQTNYLTMASLLDNIHLVRCQDYVELLAELHLLPDFLSRHPKLRLLVIDSLAFPFRQLDDLSLRTRLLTGLAQQLVSLATNHSLAVVLTNQMTTRVWKGQSQLAPALGEGWGHAANQRLLLQWAGSHRRAVVHKSPCQPEGVVHYRITGEGFRDVDQSVQPSTRQ